MSETSDGPDVRLGDVWRNRRGGSAVVVHGVCAGGLMPCSASPEPHAHVTDDRGVRTILLRRFNAGPSGYDLVSRGEGS